MNSLYHLDFKIHYFNQIATPEFGAFAEFGFAIAENNSIVNHHFGLPARFADTRDFQQYL